MTQPHRFLQAQLAIICIWLMAGCGSSFRSGTTPQAEWQLGAPIVTYWAGPATSSELNDMSAAQVAAGGWNLGWVKTVEHLDLFHRYGIRGMLWLGIPDLDDPAEAKALDATIEQVRDHPAMYAYYLCDEPSAIRFPKLGRLVSYLRERDPAHIAYINLYPTYAPNKALGTEGDTPTAYREHLRQFVDIVKPRLISYDHYHFMKSGDGDQYFLNLALVREAALQAQVPFLNIIQACQWETEWRLPTEHELRWLTYTSLAYGAHGISHFVYNYRQGPKSGFFANPPSNEHPLPIYWAVSRINRDFVAIATELHRLESLGAYHCGVLPDGAEALPTKSPFVVDPARQEILLGCFGKADSGPSHVLVVNLDYHNAASTTLVGPGPLERFHAPTQAWYPIATGKRATLELPAGGGMLVRLRR